MGSTLSAVIVFAIVAYGAAWAVSRYGPLATA